MLILVLSTGIFVFSKAFAGPHTCPICAGQSSPVQDQDCEEVNLGGKAWCYETYTGDCSESSTDCSDLPDPD